MANRWQKFKNNPLIVLKYVWDRLAPFIKDDVFYSKVRYFLYMHEFLNLEHPTTYSEKLQWIKLYYHNPEYTRLVDKLAVKEYVSEKIGSEYIIPTLAVYDRVEDIDFEKLPQQFVLKCIHDSGGLVICKDKAKLDINKAKEKLSTSLKRDYYIRTREWPYRDVPKKIIAEQYMEDEEYHELRDYKFFCYGGVPKTLFIAANRSSKNSEMTIDFFDMEFNNLHIISGHPNSTTEIQKPKCFDEMKQLATKLSEGMPEVRVDFYEVNGKVYFGEFTFFNNGGHRKYKPNKWNKIFGDWIVLPEKML